MEFNKLNSVTDKLGKYFYTNNDDYITVTKWSNGEGYDIDLNGKLVQLHDCELDAINYLVQTLRYEEK